MDHAIVFDCELLTAEGSPSRNWYGPRDPDPVAAQIGAVRLGLAEGFPLLDTLRLHVVPRDRAGQRVALDPAFTRLTGIAEGDVDREGLPLEAAMARVAAFADGARLWSWGKDELNLVAIGCYVEGLTPPIPARRFGNASRLLLDAGVPYEEVVTLRSNRLADRFGIAHPPLRAHDGLDDARSVALVLQAFLRDGRLAPSDLA